MVTVKASAGYLNGYADPEYVEKLPLMKLPFNPQGKLRTFPIKGDSMPPLSTGDYVVGKFVESAKDISSGKSYILLTKNDGIVYKRVVKNKNHLELQSDNKLYDTYKVPLSEILELWEFVCSLKTSDISGQEISNMEIMTMLQGMKNDMSKMINSK